MKDKRMKLMEVQEIELSYGTSPVIEGLSLNIYPCSLIGLIGPNGAGKTTLLMALSGQFKPQKGHVFFNSSDIYEKNLDYKRSIGYVHEHPFFYQRMSVEEFLYFVARIKGVQDNKIEMQISSILKSVNLDEEKSKQTSNLSAGMHKKLAIAAALLGDPKLIFLDEALNGIDFESIFQIKKLLTDLVAEGKTIILSTHVMEVIEKICGRYLVLREGGIIADIDPDKLKETDAFKRDPDIEKYIIQLLDS